jgi:hypothetical protein
MHPPCLLKSSHSAAHCRVMHAEERCDPLHRINAGREGPSHGLAVVRVIARELGKWLRQRPALRARDLTQKLHRLGCGAMALGEAIAAEKDLMTQTILECLHRQSLGERNPRTLPVPRRVPRRTVRADNPSPATPAPTSHCRAGARLQMAADPSPLLDGPQTL